MYWCWALSNAATACRANAVMPPPPALMAWSKVGLVLPPIHMETPKTVLKESLGLLPCHKLTWFFQKPGVKPDGGPVWGIWSSIRTGCEEDGVGLVIQSAVRQRMPKMSPGFG
jgi:hypothetical protein